MFLNVDLEVISRRDPKKFIKALDGAADILRCDRVDDFWVTLIELSNVKPNSQISDVILGLAKLLDGLPENVKSYLKNASSRTFDIGIEGASWPATFEGVVSTKAMAAIAAAKSNLKITVYGAIPKS